MTTLSDALARAPNPLAAHTVSDGDGGPDWVDIDALHSPARAALWRGSERARRGHSQVLALIGEAGSGKSHLLLWLRQQLALRGDPQTYFVAMPALPDLAQPFRHALRQLVGALCRRESTLSAAAPGEAPSGLLDRPIDVLLWGALYTQTCDLLDAARVGMYQGPATLLKLLGPMCHDAGRKRSLADFAAAAQKVWPQVEPGLRSYLLSLPTEMSIDSAARAVLLQFPHADRRALCTAWLAGEELSQKDRERLAAKQVINNENAAKYVLCSVVRLLTGPPGAQLVVSYDQTEQLVEQLGQPGIQAMAEVAAAIHSSGGSLLQVLSLRPATFGQLQERSARPTSGPGTLRHIDHTVRLAPTSPELLREIVAARVSAGLAEAADRPSVFYPFTEDDLDLGKWPKEAENPRATLQVFAKRYAQRLRELLPGSPASARHAASSPDQRHPGKSGPSRVKDAPSAPGTGPNRRLPSTQSPSADFLSNEDTGDVPAAAPGPTSSTLGPRPRSSTHPDHSGAAGAPPKAAPQRLSPSFVADSSPTVQALPKDVVAAALTPSSAKARDLAREAKANPSFGADSAPTGRAASDDVMGRVRGAGASPKRAPEPTPPAKQPAAPAAPSRNSPPRKGEEAVMGRVRPAAKPQEPAPAAVEKPSDKPAPTLAVPAAIKTTDALLVTRKIDTNAVPDFEADSSPTLKRMPDENLIQASRERSRPHSSLLIGRVAPIVPGENIGRSTPTMPAQPSLIHATRPSKPTTPERPGSKPLVVKPPVVEVAPPAPSNVPDPLPPSSESPSMGWLAMANDEDPLADAIKQAKADLANPPVAKPPAALAEPPRPTPSGAPPKQPASTPAAPKSAPTAAVASGPVSVVAARPAASALPSPKPPAALSSPPAAARAASIPPTAVLPVDNIPTELPPSAESPSMGWLAMASGSNQLDDAIAQAKSDLRPAKADPAPAPRPVGSPAEPAAEPTPKAEPEPAKVARAARPVRGNAGLGVVVVNPSTVKAPEPPPGSEPEPAAARAPVRSTLARLPAIQLRTAQSMSPQQVLSALESRGMMEEWQLAQELGLAPDALEKILSSLEDDGQVRLMAMGDGQRMVVRID